MSTSVTSRRAWPSHRRNPYPTRSPPPRRKPPHQSSTTSGGHQGRCPLTKLSGSGAGKEPANNARAAMRAERATMARGRATALAGSAAGRSDRRRRWRDFALRRPPAGPLERGQQPGTARSGSTYSTPADAVDHLRVDNHTAPGDGNLTRRVEGRPESLRRTPERP